jgi:hypothetical protein
VTIALPAEIACAAKGAVADGDCASASEVVREALRADGFHLKGSPQPVPLSGRLENPLPRLRPRNARPANPMSIIAHVDISGAEAVSVGE